MSTKELIYSHPRIGDSAYNNLDTSPHSSPAHDPCSKYTITSQQGATSTTNHETSTKVVPKAFRKGGGKYIIHEAKWNERFEELKAFFSAHGHSDVQQVYNDNPTLGRWCKNQRYRYKVYLDLTHQSENDSIAVKKKKTAPLTKEQIGKLCTVAFKFQAINNRGWRKRKMGEQKWNEQFEELKAFYKEHGHSDVPRKDDLPLAQWCGIQRYRYRAYFDLTHQSENDSIFFAIKKKKPSPLTKEQIGLLRTVAFKFEAIYDRSRRSRKMDEQKWNKQFEELKAFYKENGHSYVPFRYNDNPTLGRWCSMQRYRYRANLELTHQSENDSIAIKKGKPSPLTKEQIDKLCTVAFNNHSRWSRKMDEQNWNKQFEELKAFYKEHGHSDVPQAYNDNPTLGRWCYKQRVRYKVYLELTHQSENDSIAVKKKKHSPLTKEQMDKLCTVFFKF
jgi:hypothetical protein